MAQRVFTTAKNAFPDRVNAIQLLKSDTKEKELCVGLYTTREDKYLAVELFNAMLSVDKIKFLDVFFTNYPLPENKSRKEDLYNQICNIEYRVSEPRDWVLKKFEISGKARGPDDCGLGLVLLVFHASLLMVDQQAVREHFPYLEPLSSEYIVRALKDECDKRSMRILQQPAAQNNSGPLR